MLRVLIYFGERCRFIYLPEVRTGGTHIVLSAGENGWQQDCHIRFFALDGHWWITRPEGMRWQDDIQEPIDRRLIHGFNLAAFDSQRRIGVYCTQCSTLDTQMHRYAMPENLRIGKAKDNTIELNDEFVSEYHCEISRDSGAFSFIDHSKNGTYLNGQLVRKTSSPLCIGDTLMLACGLTLVFFGDFFACNQGSFLESVHVPTCGNVSTDMPMRDSNGCYQYHNRPPRFVQHIDTRQWKLEMPPDTNDSSRQPLLLTIGPSLTMSLPMLMGSFLAGNGGYYKSGVFMMITSSALAVFWTLTNHFYQKRQQNKQLQEALQDYASRLRNVEDEIQLAINDIMNTMLQLYPSAKTCCEMIESCSDRLWENTAGSPGFGSVRIGTGMVKLPYEISVPPLRMGEKTSGIRNAPYALQEKFDHLHKAPVTVQMCGIKPIGIVCSAGEQPFVLELLVQLAACNSYLELGMAAIIREEESELWHPARWLPHFAMDQANTGHRVAVGKAAGQQLLNQINDILSCRVAQSEHVSHGPHYLVFCTDIELVVQHPLFIGAANPNSGMTICFIAQTESELPKECDHVIHIPERTLYDYQSGIKTAFSTEILPVKMLHGAMRTLAHIRENERLETASIPTQVTMLESFSVRSIAELNIWRRWNTHSSGDDIAAVLGLAAGKRPFVLNLSDKFHGPHGIIAGTTGSGKSVLLQTLILSLALNYHPDDLQFILIDYKGGGSFECFRNIPHVIGNIDNLQGKRAINRALLSVRGEVMRREALFKSLGCADINTYIKRYQHDPTQKPLSHLLIIIDEFAELKDDMPDFMRELVSTARIGRSVGLHLILATQKPGNSVSGEIWSNSRFHICLRVQTHEDSTEMLHRPEAAYLRGMGRGYVQVGNDELFEQIQTSWCGAPYCPDAPIADEMPQLLDSAGLALPSLHKKSTATTSELTEITQEIQRIAAEKNIHSRGPLWLDELPTVIPLEKTAFFENCFPEHLYTCFGLLDDIENQRYQTAMLDLMKHPCTLLVGHSTTGKTVALESIIYSLCRTYSPSEVQVCLLGLSSMQLHSLLSVPNVIDFTGGHEVKEQKRILNILNQEIRRRNQLFAQYHTDNFASYQAIQDSPPMPALVVAADRLAQWYGVLSDAEQEQLTDIIKTAAGRGIYFIFTALEMRELPYVLRDVFMCIPLGCDSIDEYSDILGCRIARDFPLPRQLPGRGIMRDGEAVHELQVALPFGEVNAAQRYELMKEAFASASAVIPVITIPHVPERFDSSFMLAYAEKQHCTAPHLLPAAISQHNGAPIMLDMLQKHIVFVYGKRSTGKSSLLKALAHAFAGDNGDIFVMGDMKNWSSWAKSYGAHFATYDGEQDDLASDMDDAFAERKDFRLSQPGYDNPEQQIDIALRIKPLAIVLDDVDKWLEQMNDNGRPYLDEQISQRLSGAIRVGAKYHIGVFVSCNADGVSGALPGELIKAIKNAGWGFALGNTLADCNPWNVSFPYNRENDKLKAGDGFYVDDASAVQVLVPAE